MFCPSCRSDNLSEFPTEIAIHVADQDNPLVFIFPNLLICMDCGKPQFRAAFTISKPELDILAKDNPTSRRPAKAHHA